ncbi:MAG: ATP phosphoribosyltransferase [Planktomarina sp.]|jgi:ATP phosphoribosyltransferase
MIKLGVPSKGRLMKETFAWFSARGVRLSKSGSDREYVGRVDGVAGVELVLLTAGEIPRELAAGRLDMGVTGTDLVHEKLANWTDVVAPMAEMGFGFADLIIAVPACWRDVTCLHDLDAVAARFRAQQGFRLRIATKYHRLVRQFMTAQGVADYQLVDSQGATEGAVKNETAEAIADITSTGATIEANHLQILEDGLVLKSQATLWHSKLAQGDCSALIEKIGIAP